MTNKLFKGSLACLLATILAFTANLPLNLTKAGAEEELSQSTVSSLDDDQFYYVAIGDSITAGYGIDDAEESTYNYSNLTVGNNYKNSPKESYPHVIADKISSMLVENGYVDENNQPKFDWSNLGAPGFISADFLGTLLDPDYVAFMWGGASDAFKAHKYYVSEIQKADLITIHIGSNDLLVAGLSDLYVEFAENKLATSVLDALFNTFLVLDSQDNIFGLLSDNIQTYFANTDNDVIVKDVTQLLRVMSISNLQKLFLENTDMVLPLYEQIINTIRSINPNAQLVCLNYFQAFGNSYESDGIMHTIPGLISESLRYIAANISGSQKQQVMSSVSLDDILSGLNDRVDNYFDEFTQGVNDFFGDLGESLEDFFFGMNTTIEQVITDINYVSTQNIRILDYLKEKYGTYTFIFAPSFDATMLDVDASTKLLGEVFNFSPVEFEDNTDKIDPLKLRDYLKIGKSLFATIKDTLKQASDFYGTPAQYWDMIKLTMHPIYWTSVMTRFAFLSSERRSEIMDGVLAMLEYPFTYTMLSLPTAPAFAELNKNLLAFTKANNIPLVDIYNIPNENNTNPHPLSSGHKYIANQVLNTITLEPASQINVTAFGTVECAEEAFIGSNVEFTAVADDMNEIEFIKVDGQEIEHDNGVFTVQSFNANTTIEVQFSNHAIPENWSCDKNEHWLACNCGNEVFELAEHTFVGVEKKAATHLKEGLMHYTCSVCHFQYDEVIPKLEEHIFTKWNYDVKNHWYKCPCGERVDYTNHVYETRTVVAGTHLTNAVLKYTCVDCGYDFLASGEKTPEHIFTIWFHNSTEHWSVCLCGKKFAVSEHNFESKVLVKPTHLTEGVMKNTCVDCGYDYLSKIEKTEEHIFTLWLSNSSEHWYICLCGKKVGVEAHDYETTVLIKPTHVTEGVAFNKCTVCGHDKLSMIPKTEEHIFKDYSHNSKQHWQKCICGEVTSVGEHEYKITDIIKNTHLTEGVGKYECVTCGYTFIGKTEKLPDHVIDRWSYDLTGHWHVCICGAEVDRGAHTYDMGEIVKQPTHTQEGVIHFACTVCGFKISGTIDKLPEHEFTSWSIDLNSHWYVCACGEKVAVAKHTYESVAAKLPTHTEEGIRLFTCTVCGHQYEESIATLKDHVFTKWSSNNDEHWYICSCGEKVGLAKHTYDKGTILVPATHTTEGQISLKCTECGATKISKLATLPDHEYSVWFEETPAGLFNNGVVRRECACGYAEEYETAPIIVYVGAGTAIFTVLVIILIIDAKARRKALKKARVAALAKYLEEIKEEMDLDDLDD